MIKINLLPVRASKKKESAKQQISILVLSVVLIAVVFFLLYSIILIKIKTTKDEVASSERELAQLKVKIGEIDNIKKLKEEVQKKLDVLAQLRKNKTGPVKRLALLSEITPEKLWLTAYAENDTKVSVTGMAMSEELIAEFMTRLQGSQEYTGVELVSSEQSELAGSKVKRFQITCSIKGSTPQAAQPPQKK